jgi:PEP-CTERM motif
LSHVQAPYNETNHYFYAETYLVEEVPGQYLDLETGIVKKKVEIYNGVRWGWENEFTPLSSSLPTDPPPPCDNSGGGGSGGGSGGSGCSESNWAGTNNRELPLFQEDEFDSDDFYVSNNIQQEALEFNSFNAHKIAPFTPVSTASEPIPQSIPEPGTVVGILTIGLLGIGGQLRKRK